MSQREHLLQLAKAHGARIFFDVDPVDAHADLDRGEIHLGREWIEGGTNPSYWVGLHELGHVVTRPPRLSMFALLLADPVITHWEAVAWDWALRNAMSPPDEYARATIAYSLGTYLARYAVPADASAVDLVVRTVGRPDWQLAPDFNASWRGHEYQLHQAWEARLAAEAVAA